MKDGIVLLDGAVGTSLWAKAEAKGYAKDPVWIYNVEFPDIVEELSREYIQAGAKMILTNTFGANRFSVARSSPYTAAQIVKAGVEITCRALQGTDAIPVLAVGPLSVLLEPFGDLSEEDCRQIYTEIICSGVEAGAKAIMLQTFYDLSMMEIATRVAVSFSLPVFCLMTFEKHGHTMMGNSVEEIVRTLDPLGIAGIGMNCSLGPRLALPIIQHFSECTKLPLVFKPNAGLPISSVGRKDISPCGPESFAQELKPALDFVSYIGGCCGSNPSYIAEIGKLIAAETESKTDLCHR